MLASKTGVTVVANYLIPLHKHLIISSERREKGGTRGSDGDAKRSPETIESAAERLVHDKKG
jgi:hypothetical protein